MRENVMRIALTSEARQRLTNVRMVKPDVAHAIEEYIIQLVSSGRLKRTIDDEQLKEMLADHPRDGKARVQDQEDLRAWEETRTRPRRTA